MALMDRFDLGYVEGRVNPHGVGKSLLKVLRLRRVKARADSQESSLSRMGKIGGCETMHWRAVSIS